MKKEFKKQLIDQLGEKLSAHGFKKAISDQSFRKALVGGKVSFHLAFVDHSHDFDVVPDMAIRFDALQSLIFDDRQDVAEKDKKSMYSMGVGIGNYVWGEQKRWRVASSADVAIVADALEQVFITYVLPYFAKYSDLHNAFELLSATDENVSGLHSPLPEYRAMRVLGMAYLLGKSDQFAKLVEYFTDLLTRQAPFGLPMFLKFVLKIQNLKKQKL